ncbi:MAG TPA: Ku protein, partial [Gaiellaceae bacterium]|nr:Ku protein [Gaiellaceae bacterium]
MPVRMYSAVHEHNLHFNYLHTKDDSPIGYEKYCKKENKPVPDDEIGKAFEVSKDKYVYLDKNDLEAAKVEGYRTSELTDFVPYEEIDPIYFEKTYYLGPRRDRHVVMRERENLGCIRILDGVLTLEKLFFADEIRPAEGIKPKRVSVSKQELEMAEQLIDRFSGSFRPEKYKDTYTEALMKIVKAK